MLNITNYNTHFRNNQTAVQVWSVCLDFTFFAPINAELGHFHRVLPSFSGTSELFGHK